MTALVAVPMMISASALAEAPKSYGDGLGRMLVGWDYTVEID